MAKYICQACKNTDINLVTSLGYLPPVNDLRPYLSDKGINAYPLPFCYCDECGLVQLGYQLDKEIVFPSTYPYLSGVTRSLVDNFREQAYEANKILKFSKEDYVIDIGSNDGSLLKQYVDFANVIGVEPTDAADVANSDEIETLKAYFEEEVVARLKKRGINPRLVTACNVFAHIPNLPILINNIKNLIGANGVFVSESHYLIDLLENLQFDTIYHEHLRYYDVTFLKRIFQESGLRIFRVDRINSHGGSIRVWASASTKFPEEPSVGNILKYESEFKMKSLEKFPARLNEWRDSFRNLISTLKINGAKIYAIGAPSRASTLVSFAGLTELDIIAVGELQGSAKINMYMPGTKIPIVLESVVLDAQPSHLLILSWHLEKVIIDSLKSKGYSGKFIIPLPFPKLVE
jgi:hypothetical protein